jgi:hypothetical protein
MNSRSREFGHSGIRASEITLGRAMVGRRDRVILTTKCGVFSHDLRSAGRDQDMARIRTLMSDARGRIDVFRPFQPSTQVWC